MNLSKVKRLYEIKQQIKDLKAEEEQLSKEIKDEMLSRGIQETFIGSYRLQLQCQDRSTYDRSIVPFLKKRGYHELVFETYDHDKLKQLIKQGLINERELHVYKLEKLVYSLYVKTC